MNKLTVIALILIGLSLTACGEMRGPRFATKYTQDHQSVNFTNPFPAAATGRCKDPILDSHSGDREAMCELVNHQRATYGLSPVSLTLTVDLAAQLHASDMLNNNYFSHTSLSGGNVSDRVRTFGPVPTQLAENILFGSSTPQEVLEAWMNSPGHRANILNKDYNRMGIGRAGTYWVQVLSYN